MTNKFFNGSLQFWKIAFPVKIIGLLTRSQINYIISVEAKYNTKSCQINKNTVNYVIYIDLFIEQKSKNHWYIRFIVLITKQFYFF